MIQDSEATRAAHALIDQFGQQAIEVAAQRAERCDAGGSGESAEIWRAIQGAVKQIERAQMTVNSSRGSWLTISAAHRDAERTLGAACVNKGEAAQTGDIV